MEQEIGQWQARALRRPRLLLHSCCAPCSSAVLDTLSADFDITLFYYNPNISTEAEFTHRVKELQRFCHETGIDVKRQDAEGRVLAPVQIVVPPYDHREFLDIARGHERDSERGERCHRCYRERLERTACYMEAVRDAWQQSHPDRILFGMEGQDTESVSQTQEDVVEPYDYFCTTLTLSPLKSSEVLNVTGEEIAKAHGLRFLPSDFKKRGGYQRSVELSKQYHLYRQNFCGCEFSRGASV